MNLQEIADRLARLERMLTPGSQFQRQFERLQLDVDIAIMRARPTPEVVEGAANDGKASQVQKP